jgi:hypothetical protein
VDDRDDAPLEALQQAIRDLHGAESTFVEAVKVKEVFQGKVMWDGVVSVFDLTGHPAAKRAYVWSYLTDEERRRFVAILHVDPINTAHRAVQAYLVNEARKAKR